MGCFWVVLVILGFLAIVLGIRAWQRRKAKASAASTSPAAGNGEKENSPDNMSPFVRDVLGCYLILLAMLLCYSIFRLLAVEFPPDSTTTIQQVASQTSASVNTGTPSGQQPAATAAPSATGQPTPTPTPIVPIISKVIPSTLNYGKISPSITVSGSNFFNRSKIRINGDLRPTEFIQNGELRATLDQSLTTGTVFVDVVNDEAFSNSLPLQIVAYGKLYWCGYAFDIGPEARLLLLVLLAGALGSFIHALQSLVDFSGNTTLKTSWTWWYIARPFLGMALALVFYAALRGGLVAGTPSAVKDVNPYGIFTIGALAGMFSDKATQKLADIFDVLFKADDKRKDKLKKVSIKTDALPDGFESKLYTLQLSATDGSPDYTWTVEKLPKDLIFDSKTGIISGIPAAATANTYSIKITVKDSTGDADTKALNLVIKT
jgi:hypothetical protein